MFYKINNPQVNQTPERFNKESTNLPDGRNFFPINANKPTESKTLEKGTKIGIWLFFLYSTFTALIFFLAYNFLIENRIERIIEKEKIRGEVILNKSELNLAIMPYELDFAGEKTPMDKFYVREAFERDFYLLLGQDYQMLLYLKRSNKYFPYIEEELKKRGMPDDLKYIAVAESALVEEAKSSAGAVGLWQFIPTTANQYGLEINEFIDERLEYQKATRKALDYLEKLHNDFGSWSLAAAAYNTGESNIEKSLAFQKVDHYYDIYINKETSRYLYRILAIKIIMQNREQYGFKLTDSDYFYWPKTKTIKVNGNIENLNQWALENGANLKELKELNPWIQSESLPEGKWNIKITDNQ